MRYTNSFLYRLICIVLIAALCCTAFAACGNDPVQPENPDDPTLNPSEPENPENPDTPDQPDDPDAEALSEFQDSISRLMPALEAVARTLSGGGTVYNYSDSFFFWVTMYNFASVNALGMPGVTLNSAYGTVSIPADLMMEFACACFAQFNAFPSFPDQFGAVSYDAEQKVYEVRASDLTVESTVTNAAVSGTSYTLTFSMSLGNEPYVFSVVMVKNPTESTSYPYSIMNMTMVSGPEEFVG